MNSGKLLTLVMFTGGLLFYPAPVQAQGIQNHTNSRGDIRLMFYNVENLFDTIDNTLTDDNEYLPGAEKKWTGYRYYVKKTGLFKVIAAVGGLRPPEIICMAEIENDTVLKDLIRSTGLANYAYESVHSDSPDPRGVDVGLIYRSDVLSLLSTETIGLIFPENPGKKSRDILYCRFLCRNFDTLHVFVNHWPSRSGGTVKTDPDRRRAASVLRSEIGRLAGDDSCANIVISGDFNDGPFDASIAEALNVKSPGGIMDCHTLIGLPAEPLDKHVGGTYRYRAGWEVFDQLIVSGSLLEDCHPGLRCDGVMHVADFPFLLEEDTRYGGSKPKRTYQGPIYKGGFSDHLPVYMDIFFIKKSAQ